MAKFIVFEGIDGCGKGTQLSYTINFLRKSYDNLFITKEPTNSNIGQLIKSELKKDKDPRSNALKYLDWYICDRAIHEQEIKYQLKRSNTIVCDRYYYSTIAYQHIQGIELETILNKNKRFPIPDITFIIDLPQKEAVKRIKNRKEKIEKFEKLNFLEELRKEYLNMPQYGRLLDRMRGNVIKENIIIVEGNKPEKEVFEQIKQELENL